MQISPEYEEAENSNSFHEGWIQAMDLYSEHINISQELPVSNQTAQ